MKTFLELHDYFLKNGVVYPNGTVNGMCGVPFGESRLRDNEIFGLLIPTENDRSSLMRERFCKAYWGSVKTPEEALFDPEYNGLRQNIILLCAAINNEL